MRLLTFIILLCSSLAFGQSSDKAPQLKPTTLQGNGGPGVISQAPVTSDGNGGPGGGNIFYDGFPNVQDLVKTIISMKQPLRYFLNLLEGEQNPQDSELEVYKRLFPAGKPHAQKVLETLWFNPKLDGDCLDKNGNPQDAVAFSDDPNEVCFSVRRIRGKSTYKNYFEKILALSAHEILHRMAPDEDVEFLANILEHSFDPVNIEAASWQYADWAKNLAGDLKEANKAIDAAIKENTEKLSPTTLCLAIAFVQEGIDRLNRKFQETFQYQMSVLPEPVFERDIYSNIIRDGASLGYCIDKKNHKGYDANFEGKKVLSLQEYAGGPHWHAWHPEIYRDEPVYRVKYKNRKILATELAGLKADLDRAAADFEEEAKVSAKDKKLADFLWSQVSQQMGVVQ